MLLAGGAASYWLNGEPWWLFALLLLAPDVSMVGYLAGPRVGAALYNAFHSYPLPAALGIFGLLGGSARRRRRLGVVRPHRDGPDGGLRPEVRERLQGHAP